MNNSLNKFENPSINMQPNSEVELEKPVLAVELVDPQNNPDLFNKTNIACAKSYVDNGILNPNIIKSADEENTQEKVDAKFFMPPDLYMRVNVNDNLGVTVGFFFSKSDKKMPFEFDFELHEPYSTENAVEIGRLAFLRRELRKVNVNDLVTTILKNVATVLKERQIKDVYFDTHEKIIKMFNGDALNEFGATIDPVLATYKPSEDEKSAAGIFGALNPQLYHVQINTENPIKPIDNN